MHKVFSKDCKTNQFLCFVRPCTHWIHELTSLASQFLHAHVKEKKRHSSRFIGIVTPKCWFVQHQLEKTICSLWETKNKMEPNPFYFKCLEFTLFLERNCQRTKRLLQQKHSAEERKRCWMLELQWPLQTLSWENDIMSWVLSQTSSFAGQFTPNGLDTLIFHSEAASALLDAAH